MLLMTTDATGVAPRLVRRDTRRARVAKTARTMSPLWANVSAGSAIRIGRTTRLSCRCGDLIIRLAGYSCARAKNAGTEMAVEKGKRRRRYRPTGSSKSRASIKAPSTVCIAIVRANFTREIDGRRTCGISTRMSIMAKRVSIRLRSPTVFTSRRQDSGSTANDNSASKLWATPKLKEPQQSTLLFRTSPLFRDNLLHLPRPQLRARRPRRQRPKIESARGQVS